MSRQRDKIQRTAQKYALHIEELDWEPIGIALEKCGPSGGWRVLLAEGEYLLAYHHTKICEMLKNYALHGYALDNESMANVLKFR